MFAAANNFLFFPALQPPPARSGAPFRFAAGAAALVCFASRRPNSWRENHSSAPNLSTAPAHFRWWPVCRPISQSLAGQTRAAAAQLVCGGQLLTWAGCRRRRRRRRLLELRSSLPSAAAATFLPHAPAELVDCCARFRSAAAGGAVLASSACLKEDAQYLWRILCAAIEYSVGPCYAQLSDEQA